MSQNGSGSFASWWMLCALVGLTACGSSLKSPTDKSDPTFQSDGSRESLVGAPQLEDGTSVAATDTETRLEISEQDLSDELTAEAALGKKLVVKFKLAIRTTPAQGRWEYVASNTVAKPNQTDHVASVLKENDVANGYTAFTWNAFNPGSAGNYDLKFEYAPIDDAPDAPKSRLFVIHLQVK